MVCRANIPAPASFAPKIRFERLGLAVGPLALLMLLTVAAAGQTDFKYTNDNGQIIITQYTGPVSYTHLTLPTILRV